MGTNWSWPCGDRERRRYRVTTAKPKSDLKPAEPSNLNIIRVHTTINSTANLDRILQIHPKDSVPSCLMSYPNNPEEAIVISQHPDDIVTFQHKSGSYGLSPVAISEDNGDRLATLLENNLNWANTANKTFVGALTDVSGILYICYFKYDERKQENSKYIVKLIEQDITAEYLKELMSDYKGVLFRGCVKYKDKTFLILEELKNSKQKIYAVLEFSYEEMGSPGFNADMSSRIEIAVKKQGLELMGIASVDSGICAVFAKKQELNL